MTALAAYEAVLTGRAPALWRDRGTQPPEQVPVRRWTAPAGSRDTWLLDLVGVTGWSVLDVGCGPGRLTAALRDRGVGALGIDVSEVAVALARSRGVAALRRDVFAEVPATGRWDAVLLADGNVGIGGDPVALLRRAGELVAVGGRVVADLDPGTDGVVTGTTRVRAEVDGRQVGGAMRWARVGIDAAGTLAAASGLRLVRLPTAESPAAVWERTS